MYYLNKDEILSLEKMREFINDFQFSKLPRLKKLKNYYDGKQDILYKYYEDANKPCNRVVVNYCSGIVDNFNGYLTGNPISYTSLENIDDILDILKYNDCKEEDSELMKNALIYGRSYEIMYLDEDKQIRFCSVDTQEGFPIYTNDLNKELLYFVRMYQVNPLSNSLDVYIELYDKYTVKRYKATNTSDNIILLETINHYFNDVPVVILSLNKDEFGSFEKIMSMQDSYNKLLSSAEDDFESFCDAYMVVKGMDIDDEEVSNMRKNRILLLDEVGEVSYLTKDIKDTALNNLLDELNGKIHRVSNSPDFGDENFANASGISLKYKLIGFENTASNIETRFIKALQRRIELISNILYVRDTAVWRDVNIMVSRNLPVDLTETVDIVNGLKGIVSEKTLLSQIPFIQDVNNEILLVKRENKKKEKENKQNENIEQNNENDKETEMNGGDNIG